MIKNTCKTTKVMQIIYRNTKKYAKWMLTVDRDTKGQQSTNIKLHTTKGNELATKRPQMATEKLRRYKKTTTKRCKTCNNKITKTTSTNKRQQHPQGYRKKERKKERKFF